MAYVTFSRSEEKKSVIWSSQRPNVECMVPCWVLVVKWAAGDVAIDYCTMLHHIQRHGLLQFVMSHVMSSYTMW